MRLIPESPRSRSRTLAFLVAAIATAVFWRTAYPTITWWDSSEYSLAAGTLGVMAAPASLLLTLLGWPLAHLPLGPSPARVLNLFAGVLAAVTVLLVYVLAMRLLRVQRNGEADPGAAPMVGAALGALTFAFGPTLWEHAVKFTPYVLTAVFTGLILFVLLRWWERAEHPSAWRWLALLGLLFGLDFSVHRTNALLIPGALAWILFRYPETVGTVRAWLGGVGGLVAGLAVQLLVMPIAAISSSPLSLNDLSTFSGFWSYISLEQRGGGFLVQLFPRNAPFWSVQVADFARVLGSNVLHLGGAAGILGALPAIAAVGGLVVLWRNDRRLAYAFAAMLFLQMAATVLYFNIPAQYFRSFDRHYLPVLMPIAILGAYGMAAAMRAVARAMVTPSSRMLAAAAALVLVLIPMGQLIRNWPAQDASRNYVTRDFATNTLETLPPNAILFTAGDNDTFPLLYVQELEGVRHDVTIINVSLANLPTFARQLQRREPSFPLAMTRAERAAWLARDSSVTALTIPVTGTAESLGLPPGTAHPSSITIHVKPRYGKMFPAEITVLDIVRTNNWRRPLCFALTLGPEGMEWLQPYGRPDGLFWRIVPLAEPRTDETLLRKNLLSLSRYRGYADARVTLDRFSTQIGMLYHFALQPLLAADQARGDLGRCREDRTALEVKVPLERLALPAEMRESIGRSCAG